MSKALNALGVVALIGWSVFGFFAWFEARTALEDTLQRADESDTQVRLLADRVDALSRDMNALASSLEENFGRLAEALEEGRSAEAAEASGTANSSNAASVAPEGGGRTETSQRSFLAFRLPSRDFRFEGLQSFELLPDLSRVGFDAKSTLHDFSGVSNRVKGGFRVDLAQPRELAGRISIPTASLSTDLPGRDEAMREHLGATEHPEIVFVPSGFEAKRIDAEAKRLSGTLQGKLTIHGETRGVRMPVEAHVDEGRRLVIEGEMPLRFPDYGVDVPSQLGMISVEKEVRLWIHLRARVKPEKKR